MNQAEAIVCDVETTMKYVVRGEKATFHAGDRARSYWPVDEHPVTIHDVRPIRDRLSFDRNGFVLIDEPTDVTGYTDKDELARYCAPMRPARTATTSPRTARMSIMACAP